MRSRLRSILRAMVVVLAGTLLAAVPAAASGATVEGGPYRIGDPASDRFALVGNPILGTRVAMVPPSDPSSWYHLNQQWFFEDAGSGGVNIVNARSFFGSDWCMVPPPTPAVEPYAHIYPCNGGADQVWTLEATAGGVQIVSQTRDECLTMPPVSSPGNSMWLQECGGPDQVYVISPAS